MNRFIAFASTAALLVVSWTAEAAQPWYERDTCMRATEAVMAGTFEVADKRLERLEASKDPDDQACGVWVRLLLAEVQMGIGGKLPALLENRDRRVKRLYGFSKAHAKYAARFADLELEARMKRVRYLAEDGHRSDALKEAKRVQELVELRGKSGVPSSPSFDYAVGTMNLAVAFAAWPVRMVLKLSGANGDGDLGAKKVLGLYRGNTVYKLEAAYLLRAFAWERPGDVLGSSTQYSQFLIDRFPDNPQFLYEHSEDLWRDKKCTSVVEKLRPIQTALAKEPGKWSNRIRGKIYWMSGRCALDVGDKGSARRYAELAKAQHLEEIEDRVQDLLDDLDDS